jgi:hypothetical protein
VKYIDEVDPMPESYAGGRHTRQGNSSTEGDDFAPIVRANAPMV